MIGLRRWWALRKLDEVDAEIARWFVDDGTLSLEPLDEETPSLHRIDLRRRRREAVARLERAGGRDPWPTVLREPTDAQRRGYAERRR